MKKSAMIVGALMLVFTMAMAEDTHQMMGNMAGHGHDHGMCLNNVVGVDADGNKTALCGCGMEFTVTDNSPSITADGMTVYACSEECASKLSGMDDRKRAGKIGELKTACEMHKNLATNAAMMDGKLMADCPCGKHFEVTDHSPYVVENGVKMYVCGNACVAGFSTADKDKREKAQMKTRMMTH